MIAHSPMQSEERQVGGGLQEGQVTEGCLNAILQLANDVKKCNVVGLLGETEQNCI